MGLFTELGGVAGLLFPSSHCSIGIFFPALFTVIFSMRVSVGTSVAPRLQSDSHVGHQVGFFFVCLFFKMKNHLILKTFRWMPGGQTDLKMNYARRHLPSVLTV